MGNTPSTHSTDSGASQDISSGSGAGSAGTTGAAADGRGSRDVVHNRFGGSNRKSSAEAKGLRHLLRRYSRSSDRGSTESRGSVGVASHQQGSSGAGPSKKSSSSSSPLAPTSPTGYNKQPSPAAAAAALASAPAAGLPPFHDSGSGRAEQSGTQQQDTAAATMQPLPQQQQQQQPLASAFQGGPGAPGPRRSDSPGSAGQQVSKQSSQQPQPQQQGSSPGQRQRTLSGQLVSPTNSGNLPTVVAPAGRASFAIDALGPPSEGPLTASRAGGPGSGSSTAGPPARATSGQPPLPPSAKQQLQQQQQNRQRLSPDVLEEHANHQGSSTTSSGGGGTQGENSSGSHARRVRASMESCGSRASSARSGAARSTRSSFAMEAALEDACEGGDGLELDAYGRPSFAAFENTLRGRGAVFEASLPPDLAAMYRQLAVLLPQAPVPLVTVLQLWGITDPQEAQETVQIFVMQGVLKVATLPDGASWIMPSPEHQECAKAAHPEGLHEAHEAVLEVYRRQVTAARHMQQQQLLSMGDPAGAVLINEGVKPSEYVNDGYIWLALTHHLLGAGRLDQVRSLLIDPAWLEVKLHCYGVAVVVDDFRSYLQVEADPLVKAVLQAFQMSLSCCMERSHVPLMRSQLVLRLMAAAQAASAAASTPIAAALAANSRSSSSFRRSMDISIGPTAGSAPSLLPEGSGDALVPGRTEEGAAFLAAALDLAAVIGTGTGAAATPVTAAAAADAPEEPPRRMSLHSNSSAGGSAASFSRQQAEYATEMQAWYKKQYTACCVSAGLLWPRALLMQQPQQQALLPPHLMGYNPSLQQAGGRQRMALRGHLGPIRCVVISPSGKDVLTASDDGGVQVWDMDIGDCILQLKPPQPPTAMSPMGVPAAAAAPQPLTCLAVTPDGSCCLSGDVEGWLTCWHLSSGVLVQRVRAHNGRLNAIVIDRGGSRCVTAGQDRAARLWSLPAAAPGLSHTGAAAGSPLTAGRMGSMLGMGDAGSLISAIGLEMELTGHGLSNLNTGAVLDVALSHDGVLGASCSDDFSVRVWDLEHKECLHTCKGHTGWVVSVQFIGASHMLVSASHDGTARVWDAWSGDCVSVLSGHSGRLNAVVTSMNGSVIISCSDDNSARVWDGNTYKLIRVLEGHTSWINEVAVTSNGRRAVTASGDGTARLWDTRSGSCLQVLAGHSEDVTCVVLTSRGRFAVTGSLDGTAQVWDMHGQDVSSTDIHDGKVIAIVSQPDGSCAASIGTDGHLRLWDISTGSCLSDKVGHTTATPQQLQLVEDGSLAFSASGARKLIRWDMATGTPSLCLQQKQGSRTKCMHLSADGSIAVVLLFDSTMAVYNTNTGELVCELMRKGERDAMRVHSGGVNGVLLTADGRRAISWSKDATARVWDTSTGACTLVLQGHQDSITTAALSADETLLATASYDKTARLWALGPNSGSGSSSGICLKVLQHTDPVSLVAFSGTRAGAAAAGSTGAGASAPATGTPSRRLVTACDGHALWLWDVESGACVAALGEHKDRVTSVTFSPDGAWLASTSQDRSVLVWDAAAGHLVGLYVGDATMVCCCFAWRGSPQTLPQPPELSNGRLRVKLLQQLPGRQQVLRQQQQQAAAVDTSTGHTSGTATPAAAVGGPGTGEVGLWPSPGGLTLMAGDTTGHVHFIACW